MFSSANQKLDLIMQQKQLFQKIFAKSDNTWKIIVYDQANQDIISALFKKKNFRQNNITLSFNIKQLRQQIHGVSVIYIVKPTMENVELIIEDFQHDLYSSVVVHFSSEPPAHLLSTFAKTLSKRKPNSTSKIQKVQYSNTGFQCIDRQMCILSDNIEVINLLSMLKQNIPQQRTEPFFIYDSSQQDFVNILKERLESSQFMAKIKQSDQNQFKQSKKYTKVLIFNRQSDFFPIFSHGITYASFMQDVWKFNKTGTKLLDKKQQIDLNDEIWLQRKNMLISQLQLQKEFTKIKTKLMGINNKMQEFSELTQKQKRIQWHLTNVEQIITQAKSRRLNQFHSIEQELYTKKMLTGQNKQQFMQLITTAQNQQDKARLILTYLICTQNYDQNQVQEIENTFPQIKKNNFYNELKTKRMKNQSQQNINSKYFKMAKGLWKNLVNQEKKYLLVKYLQKTKDFSDKILNEMALKVAFLNNEFPINPKTQNTIVYCVGGICFNQYANLMEFDPNVIYTGNKFINYRQFM